MFTQTGKSDMVIISYQEVDKTHPSTFIFPVFELYAELFLPNIHRTFCLVVSTDEVTITVDSITFCKCFLSVHNHSEVSSELRSDSAAQAYT